MAEKKKTAPKARPKAKQPQESFKMAREVKDWIEYAESKLRFLTNEVERLKKENADLKSYQRFAEARILKSEHE